MKEVDDVLDNFIDVINNHREDLQKKINVKFKATNLLIKSLTHKSFDKNNNNEKIEFQISL